MFTPPKKFKSITSAISGLQKFNKMYFTSINFTAASDPFIVDTM